MIYLIGGAPRCGKTTLAKKFAADVHKSATPNDWLIVLTKQPETFVRVGQMISNFSKLFEQESAKFHIKFYSTEQNFNRSIVEAAHDLIN